MAGVWLRVNGQIERWHTDGSYLARMWDSLGRAGSIPVQDVPLDQPPRDRFDRSPH